MEKISNSNRFYFTFQALNDKIEKNKKLENQQQRQTNANV